MGAIDIKVWYLLLIYTNLKYRPGGRKSFNLLPMAAGHSVYLAYFVYSYLNFQPESMASLKKFYKTIWNLFYLEYCLYPFI